MKPLLYLIMAFCEGDSDFRMGCLSNAVVIGFFLLICYIVGVCRLA